MGDASSSALAAPPKKKSIFKKKIAPQTKQAPATTNHVESFSRANELFAARMRQEQEERAAAQLEKKRSESAQLEKKRSKSYSRDKSESSPRPDKKVKIQSEEDKVYSSDSDGGDGGDGLAQNSRRESTLSTPGSSISQRAISHDRMRSPQSLMGQFRRDVQDKKKANEGKEAEAKGYISVSDSDDDSVAPAVQSPTRSNSTSPPTKQVPIIITISDDDDDDDVLPVEEHPELLAQARERRRLAQAAFANQNHASGGLSSLDGGADVFQDESLPPADPTVTIFITSRLQDSTSMMVKRKMSQRLREVRLAWCDRQVFDEQRLSDDVKDTIFLTWKTKRIFDSMTCCNLRIKFDSQGGLLDEGDGFDQGRIAMEAWTQDLFDACQRAGEIQDEESDKEVVEPVEAKPKRIRLVLKANSKDIQDYKARVSPSTTMQKLIDIFRHERGIPANKTIILDFDGDHLAPQSTVADADMEDLDTIDVHIK